MKAEERKALETNDLKAGWDKVRESLGQGPSRSVVVVLVIAVVVVVLFLAWRWFSISAAETSSGLLVQLEQMNDGTDIRALDKFYDPDAVSPEAIPFTWSKTARRDQIMVKQLEAFAQAHARGLEGRMARLRLARLSLYLGQRDVTSPNLTFKTTARQNLERARDVYHQLIAECADLPVLQQEAILNQARACESLGDFDQARNLYKQVSDKDADSPSGSLAKQALARLDSKDSLAKELYQQTLGTMK